MILIEDEDDYDETPALGTDKAELQNVLKTLSAKLEDLQTCSDLIAKQCAALQRSLAEAEAVSTDNPQEILTKMKAVNERATLFRITSSAMVNVCEGRVTCLLHSAYVDLFHSIGVQRIRAVGPDTGAEMAENAVARARAAKTPGGHGRAACSAALAPGAGRAEAGKCAAWQPRSCPFYSLRGGRR